MAKSHITLTVNGKSVEALVEPRTLLIHFLREQLGFTGPHIGCETSHCGACTVDLDGKSVKSCTVFAVQANGADVRTIEGMAAADGSLHVLQEAFREMHGLQCGFCTPGMILRAYRLLQENPNPTEDEIRMGISGNLCRCTGYQNIVKAIHTAKASAVPGVVAVITAETLKTVNLAWMPTLAGDVQMVLADGKVLFQNQEVAFVIAEDRYIAADAADLVEIEYESLPVNVDPLKAMTPDAPMIREDLKDKTDGAHGKRKHYNHIFSWQSGDKAATDTAFAKADVTIKELIVYPRCHPCPLETCQCVASFDKIKGELTLWGTFQAPHVIRTVGSLIS